MPFQAGDFPNDLRQTSQTLFSIDVDALLVFSFIIVKQTADFSKTVEPLETKYSVTMYVVLTNFYSISIFGGVFLALTVNQNTSSGYTWKYVLWIPCKKDCAAVCPRN